MNQKRSVLLVIFDLPAVTAEEKRLYARFRKKLISDGYTAIQESVYLRLLPHRQAIDGALRELDLDSPKEGAVFALPLTLSQFAQMTVIRGRPFDLGQFAYDVLYIGA